MLAKQLETLDRRIAEHLAQYQSDLAALLKSVKGVGPATAATLISELPDLGQLKAKQICVRVICGLASGHARTSPCFG